MATTPRLAEILIDPVQMERDSNLVLSQSEIWAWVGEAIPEQDESGPKT